MKLTLGLKAVSFYHEKTLKFSYAFKIKVKVKAKVKVNNNGENISFSSRIPAKWCGERVI